jgi:hypothetical protein
MSKRNATMKRKSNMLGYESDDGFIVPADDDEVYSDDEYDQEELEEEYEKEEEAYRKETPRKKMRKVVPKQTNIQSIIKGELGWFFDRAQCGQVGKIARDFYFYETGKFPLKDGDNNGCFDTYNYFDELGAEKATKIITSAARAYRARTSYNF